VLRSVICGFLLLTAALAQPLQQEPLIGEWHLRFDESTFASRPQYKRVTTKIEPRRDGLKVVYDMVGVRGGVTHWEWMGRVDGRDYALQGVEEVVTNAYVRTADRQYTITTKVNGRVTTTATITISPDGRIMTVTSPGNRAIYYRK
jgi:hypothetical protein